MPGSTIFVYGFGGFSGVTLVPTLGFYTSVLTPPPTPTVPSDAQIEDALNGRQGPVRMRFGAQQLDSALMLLNDVSSAFFEGSLDLDNSRSVVREGLFSVRPQFLPGGFDVNTHLLKPYVEVFVRPVNAWVRFYQGVYRMDNPSELHTSRGNEQWLVSVADLGIKLQEATYDAVYSIPAGTNYVTAVETIFDELMLPHVIPPTTMVTPCDFIWPAYTSKGKIVEELMTGINYYMPWADNEGTFRSRTRWPDSGVTDVVYSTLNEPRMVLDGWTRAGQPPRFPNRIVVKRTDPLLAPASVSLQNDDPTNSVSTVRRGTLQTEEVANDRAYDRVIMGEQASYMLWDYVGQSLIGDLNTVLDPRRQPHETYQLFIEDVDVGTYWRVATWSMQLSSGAPMTHRLEAAQTITLAAPTVIA